MSAASETTRRPRLAVVCVPGLSIGHVPPLDDRGDRCIRALESPFPITDSSFVASVATGLPPWRHGVGADFVWDTTLGALRPPNRSDMLADPIWEILARVGYRARVAGCSLARGDEWPGDTGSVMLDEWEPGEGQGRARLAASMEELQPDLSEEAIGDVLGGGVVAAMRGEAGVSRRRACDAIDALRRLLLVHNAVTLALDADRDDRTPDYDFVSYQSAGELFRNSLVEKNRLSAFLAQIIQRVHDLCPIGSRLVVCSMPTESTKDCVSHAPVPGRVARGVVLCIGPRAGRPVDSVRTGDVFASMLAVFGRARPLELISLDRDPLRLTDTEEKDRPFTYTVRSPIEGDDRHPETRSIRRILNSAGGYTLPRVASRDAKETANAAAISAAAMSDGAPHEAMNWARAADGTGAYPATNAALAFGAVSASDGAELRERLHRLERDGGATPLLLAGNVLLKAMDGDDAGARSLLHRAETELTEGSSRVPPEARPVLALAAERCGWADEALRLWSSCSPRLERVARARMAALDGRWGECLKWAVRAFDDDPSCREAAEHASLAYGKLGRFEKGIEVIAPFHAQNPSDEFIRSRLVSLLRGAGRTDEAIRLQGGEEWTDGGARPRP